jgi:hypothetical protein
MNKEYTIIVLAAAIAVVASGLILIPTQSAAAQTRSVDVNAGPIRVHAGSDGVSISLGSAERASSNTR